MSVTANNASQGVLATALISHISRGSLHDGSGIRTVVYFMGCGLRCAWCHNPETFSARPVLVHRPTKCIGCRACAELCPDHHPIGETGMTLVREGCTLCGRCAHACPTGALSLCGEAMTVDGVLAAVRKDMHYYTESGGGVTLSGGECLLHADFCAELLRRCHEEGISTTIETALFVPWDAVARVLPYTDHVFADLKLPDAKRHREWTGQDNRLILDNLSRLHKEGVAVTVRIPLIPGVNDSPADMEAFGRLLASLGAREVELLRYNYLAEGKYEGVGLPYVSFGKEAQSDGQMALLSQRLASVCPSLRITYR